MTMPRQVLTHAEAVELIELVREYGRRVRAVERETNRYVHSRERDYAPVEAADRAHEKAFSAVCSWAYERRTREAGSTR